MINLSRLVLAALCLCAAAGAYAQSSCDSDGQPRPVALLERFINADCEACWSDANTPKAGPRDLTIDWVLPGSQGDDAPLATVARRDGLARLDSFHRAVPAKSDSLRRKLKTAPQKLRVAHGLPFNDYIGTSIELKPGAGGPWKAWLVLVETIPAGIEGSPVERNLVRNTFQPPWDSTRALSKREGERLFEARPMQIPEGVKGERLRVVAWVEDASGRVVAAAQSACRPNR